MSAVDVVRSAAARVNDAARLGVADVEELEDQGLAGRTRQDPDQVERRRGRVALAKIDILP